MQPQVYKNKCLEFLFWIILSIIFTIIAGGFTYNYSNNQTTYFVFGLAKGGLGNLSTDWFVNTIDPLPVFSFLVQFTYQYLGEFFFQIYQISLLGIFLFSSVQITDHFFRIRRSKLLFFSFLTIYLASFSVAWPVVKSILHTGVAGQYLSIEKFLPTMFAAFLFLSLALFLKKKYYLAILSLAIAGNVHSNYLIIGAVLVSSYMIIVFLETKNFKQVLSFGLVALIFVLPIVLNTFGSNTNATIAQLQETSRIIVEERIPYHTQVTAWWRTQTTIRLFITLLAIFVMRKSKYLPLFVIAFLTTFLPALVLYVRPSNAISILQIWRVSVFLVPLSSMVLLGSAISYLFSKTTKFFEKHNAIINILLGAILICLIVLGITSELNEHAAHQNLPERQLYNYIGQNANDNDLFLIPPINRDLNNFRLETGTPIFINWKSHPWNAIELLEWYDRINLARAFYESRGTKACRNLAPIIETFPITHIVTLAERPLECENLSINFQDELYILYSLETN